MVLEIPAYVRRSKSSFYYPMLMLPREKRHALMAVYAFCRYTDDMIDGAQEFRFNPADFLEHWKREFSCAVHGRSQYAFLNQVTKIARDFSIPFELFFSLINGMEMDVKKNRYGTFDELYEYCYNVASTVGLMCIHIMGKSSAEAYAVHLGIAMQLTNIIRDVSSDFRRDRVYIPQDELERFGLDSNDWLADKQATRALMQFQCDRAGEFYRKAEKSYAMEKSYLLLPARMMNKIYFELYRKIESRLPALTSTKIALTLPEKFQILISTWLDERRNEK